MVNYMNITLSVSATEQTSIADSSAIEVGKGTIQQLTLTADSELSVDLKDGESVTLEVVNTTHALSFASGIKVADGLSIAQNATTTLVLYRAFGVTKVAQGAVFSSQTSSDSNSEYVGELHAVN